MPACLLSACLPACSGPPLHHTGVPACLPDGLQGSRLAWGGTKPLTKQASMPACFPAGLWRPHQASQRAGCLPGGEPSPPSKPARWLVSLPACGGEPSPPPSKPACRLPAWRGTKPSTKQASTPACLPAGLWGGTKPPTKQAIMLAAYPEGNQALHQASQHAGLLPCRLVGGNQAPHQASRHASCLPRGEPSPPPSKPARRLASLPACGGTKPPTKQAIMLAAYPEGNQALQQASQHAGLLPCRLVGGGPSPPPSKPSCWLPTRRGTKPSTKQASTPACFPAGLWGGTKPPTKQASMPAACPEGNQALHQARQHAGLLTCQLVGGNEAPQHSVKPNQYTASVPKEDV